MNSSELKDKYCIDINLAAQSVAKMDPSIVSGTLKQLAGGKVKSIPREYIDKVADNAMEWAKKDKAFNDAWNKASFGEKKTMMVQKFKEYVSKFKWSIAAGLKKYGVFDSVDGFSAAEFKALNNSMKSSDYSKFERSTPKEAVIKNHKVSAAVWKNRRKDGINGGNVTKLYVIDPKGTPVASFRDGRWMIKPGKDVQGIVEAFIVKYGN